MNDFKETLFSLHAHAVTRYKNRTEGPVISKLGLLSCRQTWALACPTKTHVLNSVAVEGKRIQVIASLYASPHSENCSTEFNGDTGPALLSYKPLPAYASELKSHDTSYTHYAPEAERSSPPTGHKVTKSYS